MLELWHFIFSQFGVIHYSIGTREISSLDDLSTGWFQTHNFLVFIIGIILICLAIIVAMFRYRKWLHFNEFLCDMKTLDLPPKDETTLVYMVKRYSSLKTSKVLRSIQVFDDMASQEMLRILAGKGSQENKEDFVDTVYRIRNTAHSSRYVNEEKAETIK